MKRLHTLIAILFMANICHCFGQLTLEQKNIFAKALQKKINFLRQKQGLHKLIINDTLSQAGELQSKYLTTHQLLSSFQMNSEHGTPQKRVNNYTNNFINIEENVSKSRSIKPAFTKKKLTLLSNLVIKSWLKSYTSKRNILSNKFTHMGFGFSYHKETNRIYTVNVFATKKYKVKNQLSQNTFGIADSNISCELSFEYSNIIASMGNRLKIENNEVIFSYHDIEYFNKIFTEENDGLAVDLVTKKQMKCGFPNTLHSSTIHDGVLLKPVYRDEILKANRAKSDYRIIVSLGKIPVHLQNKELSTNLLIIKNKTKCAYKVPVSIPSASYSLIPIAPEIIDPPIHLNTEGIGKIREIYFDFENSKTTPFHITKDTINIKDIASVDVRSYTSINGSLKHNQFLYRKRAEFINRYLKNKLKITGIPINTTMKENWELHDFLLEISEYKHLLKESKKEKRAFANTFLKDLWKEEFALQRKSKATIFENFQWSKEDKNHYYYNLIDALLKGDIELANKALAKLYLIKDENYILEHDFLFERILIEKDLVQNTSALIIKNIQYYPLNSVIFYINYWLEKHDKLSKEAKKNLLNLYAITTKNLLMFWDVDRKNLAQVLHPNKVFPMLEEHISEKQSDPLLLNYHMAAIEYFGQTNNFSRIEESFNFVTSYFKEKSVSINDKVNLALFFNNWSRYDLTIDLLVNSYTEESINEKAMFILAQTVLAYPQNYNDQVLKMIQKDALRFNKKRWCTWISHDFQNLRENYIKELYCSKCNRN